MTLNSPFWFDDNYSLAPKTVRDHTVCSGLRTNILNVIRNAKMKLTSTFNFEANSIQSNKTFERKIHTETILDIIGMF